MESLFAMGGSALFGFIFKLIANMQENKAKQQLALIKGMKATDDSMDKAEERGSTLTRRFVVFVMISLFAYLTMGISEPTNIVQMTEGTSYLFGLWTTDPKTIVTTVEGTIFDETTRLSVLSIISFLFGIDSAKR